MDTVPAMNPGILKSFTYVEIFYFNINALADAIGIFCVVAIFVVSFSIVGCFGVIKENKSILKTYLALNVIMFIGKQKF